MTQENQASWQVIGGNNDIGIGSNSHLFQNKKGKEETNVLVDMGMKMGGGEFNEIPDVREEIKNSDALVFTHCHADHIQGLIDYVKMGYDFTKEVINEKNGEFEKKPVPLVGSAFTVSYIKAELARNKINGSVIDNIFSVIHDGKNKEFDIPESIENRVLYSYEKGDDGKDRLKLSIGKEGTKVNLSLFDMDHSAKGSTAVGIEIPTDAKTYRILHLGDWKKEDGQHEIIDKEGLKGFAKKGFDALLMDSTSTIKPTTKNFEIDVKESVREKLKEAFNEIEAEDGKQKAKEGFAIIHSSIARSANRIFDCDVIGSVEALKDLGRLKSGDEIDVYMHGGAAFTQKVMEAASSLSDSKQYNVIKEFQEKTGVKINFVDGKTRAKKKSNSYSFEEAETPKAPIRDEIHVTTGTQADELAQLKKMSMIETRSKSSLPSGDNVIYIETQTPIPSGNNVENVAIMNEDLKSACRVFETAIHSSGHASKEASDEMAKFLMENNPNKKNSAIYPIHGAFSQNHLDATAQGLDNKGLKTEIVRNGNKMSFTEEGVKIEKTKEKGAILVVNGPIVDMNEKNPYGDDINHASKRGTVENYIGWANDKNFKAKSYVYQSPEGSLSVVHDAGGVYEEGDTLDRNNLKEDKNRIRQGGGKKHHKSVEDASKDYGKCYESGQKNNNGKNKNKKKNNDRYGGRHGGRR